MINFKRRVGIDVDDVLMPCVPIAIDMVNENELDNLGGNPIDISEITSWDMRTDRTKHIIKYFDSPELYKRQTPLPGAQKFIHELSKVAEIFITTAIGQDNTELRIRQIKDYFPEIDPRNIIPSYRKDVIKLDFTLDDGSHNILKSTCQYPVLMRRPWNQNITGILSVNSYDEFLNIIKCVNGMYSTELHTGSPVILALVGPSASGKKEIAKYLVDKHDFNLSRTATTRETYSEGYAYDYISEEEFLKLEQEGKFAETSVYAGARYGSLREYIDYYIKNNKNIVMPLDISGAISMKMQYENVVIAYVQRDRDSIIESLLTRVAEGKSSVTDIKNRIISLDNEKKNKMFCDIIINNNSTISCAVTELLRDLNL